MLHWFFHFINSIFKCCTNLIKTFYAALHFPVSTGKIRSTTEQTRVGPGEVVWGDSQPEVHTWFLHHKQSRMICIGAWRVCMCLRVLWFVLVEREMPVSRRGFPKLPDRSKLPLLGDPFPLALLEGLLMVRMRWWTQREKWKNKQQCDPNAGHYQSKVWISPRLCLFDQIKNTVKLWNIVTRL